MIRKHPRNDVENPPGQIVVPIPQELLPVKQGKPLVKELSEYEELLRKNNSENAR